MIIRNFAFTFLIMAALAEAAAWPQSSVATAPPGPSHHLSLLGFTLGRSTIDEVRNKLGDSKIRKSSKEEEASNEICYVSSAPDRTTVVFKAGFSGAWKEVDGFKLVASGLNVGPYRECPTITVAANSLQTPGGLRLGLTRQELMRLLGKPTHTSRDKLIFQWQSRKRMTEKEIAQENKIFASTVKDAYWDVLDTINVVLQNNTAVEVEVLHTVSY